MYRAIAYYLVKNEIDIEDEVALTAACKRIQMEIKYENDSQQVYLNGDNVTPYLRTEETGNMASKSSAKAPVRAALLDLQRNMAKQFHVVMDGRDIGTNVLKDAEVKIYLTASSKERANRRYKELIEKGADPQSLPSPFIVSFIIKYSKELETGLYIIDEVSVPAYNITFPRSSLIDIFNGVPCCNSYYNINCFDLVQK